MKNPLAISSILAMVALLVIVAACGGGETKPETAGLSPSAPEQDDPAPREDGADSGDPSGGQVSSGMLLPRPNTIQGLVEQSHIIVLGTISSVLDEKVMYYGEDGTQVLADEESGLPYTDYEVRIETVLKGDGGVEDGGTLILRMFGHLSKQNDAVSSVPVKLPQLGSHYLLALGLNLDGTYGSGSEGLIRVDGETVTYDDGIPFSTELKGEEFVAAVGQETGAIPATDTAGTELDEQRFRELITLEDVENRLTVQISLTRIHRGRASG